MSAAIKLFFAANILLYAIALGKEGSSDWWCTYCDLFKDHWQEYHHDPGAPWTITKLIEHLDKIVNLEDSGDKITAQDQKGVNEYPLFKAVPVSESLYPILHITIGKGNNVVDNLLEES